ncbi:hypothetical protein P7K49_025102 [Saguinus oedipus]|uniref:Uncharacterized protein n=1 Tax=Saguinus oedipus TaxID=9490 RepID=A0ABQ9UHL0_SAGOE|nr:hypothetical protein P7K49_025102 [Saguinus oedipus]
MGLSATSSPPTAASPPRPLGPWWSLAPGSVLLAAACMSSVATAADVHHLQGAAAAESGVSWQGWSQKTRGSSSGPPSYPRAPLPWPMHRAMRCGHWVLCSHWILEADWSVPAFLQHLSQLPV